MNAVYSYGKDRDHYLLVDANLWVINGEWQLKKKGDVFLHPLTGEPIDIVLAGYIDYDGDYNSTLSRFRDGEGKHLDSKVEDVVLVDLEFCKKQYYGIDCSCHKCGKR